LNYLIDEVAKEILARATFMLLTRHKDPK